MQFVRENHVLVSHFPWPGCWPAWLHPLCSFPLPLVSAPRGQEVPPLTILFGSHYFAILRPVLDSRYVCFVWFAVSPPFLCVLFFYLFRPLPLPPPDWEARDVKGRIVYINHTTRVSLVSKPLVRSKYIPPGVIKPRCCPVEMEFSFFGGRRTAKEGASRKSGGKRGRFFNSVCANSILCCCAAPVVAAPLLCCGVFTGSRFHS